jgi:phosphatidate cytidylyltransferase
VLRTRLWTAAIALPSVVLLVLFAPPVLFNAVIGMLALWGLYEIAAMVEADLTRTLVIAIVGGAPLIILTRAGRGPWLAPAIVTLGMLGLVARVATAGGEGVARGPWLATLGALWVGVLFPYLAFLRNARGAAATILMLLLSVASDSGAYFLGRWRGRTKLAYRVSPNKTVEGAAGGLATCVITGFLLRPLLEPSISVESLILFAVCVGILTQLGDLAGSAFKRVARVKDSGWIFPGHGGLLDRTCSLVFAAAFTYYYIG